MFILMYVFWLHIAKENSKHCVYIMSEHPKTSQLCMYAVQEGGGNLLS